MFGLLLFYQVFSLLRFTLLSFLVLIYNNINLPSKFSCMKLLRTFCRSRMTYHPKSNFRRSFSNEPPQKLKRLRGTLCFITMVAFRFIFLVRNKFQLIIVMESSSY